MLINTQVSCAFALSVLEQQASEQLHKDKIRKFITTSTRTPASAAAAAAAAAAVAAAAAARTAGRGLPRYRHHVAVPRRRGREARKCRSDRV